MPPPLNSPVFGGQKNGTPGVLRQLGAGVEGQDQPARSSNIAMAPAGSTLSPANSVAITPRDSNSRLLVELTLHPQLAMSNKTCVNPQCD